MAKFNIHAGHCPDGKGASGAVGILKESTEQVVHGKGGVDYVETSGKRAKRPFYTAYLAKKNAIQKRLESILKGLGK